MGQWLSRPRECQEGPRARSLTAAGLPRPELSVANGGGAGGWRCTGSGRVPAKHIASEVLTYAQQRRHPLWATRGPLRATSDLPARLRGLSWVMSSPCSLPGTPGLSTQEARLLRSRPAPCCPEAGARLSCRPRAPAVSQAGHRGPAADPSGLACSPTDCSA